MFTRLGAVSELRSRLGNDDVAVALGAHEALRTIARGDISTVAEAATSALREVALNVIESEVRFGRVPLGSPQRRVIPLPDHPLVRACTVDTEQQWIVAILTQGGLAIEVDTATPGDRHGEVAIKGPTGEAAISVRVEVVSEHAPPPTPPEPEPPPTPQPDDVPVPETPVPSGRARVATAGPFAIAAAVLLVLSLMSYYADDVQLVLFRPFAASYVVGMVVVAVVTGAMTLATRVRRPVAAGAVLGSVAVSVWGWVFLAVDSTESGATATGIGIGPSMAEEAQTTLSAGFWLLVGGHLALAVAGVCVLASREWRVASRRRGFRPVQVAAALGLPGAVMMFVEATSLNGVSGMIYPSMWSLSLTTGLMALVIAGSIFLVRSNEFSIGLVATWAGGGLAIATSHYQFVADAGVASIGFVVAFGLILLIQLGIAIYSGRQPQPTPIDN
jgi:hypothetical protein